MTSPAQLHAAVWAALQTMTTVTAFDGDVPTAPPALPDGRVLPYAVLWPSPGGSANEAPIVGGAGLAWFAQVTVAAGTSAWVLQAVTKVRQAIAGAAIVTDGDGPLVDTTPPSITVQRDPDVTPTRWFVPLTFACLTA